jgi:hypothetical protein
MNHDSESRQTRRAARPRRISPKFPLILAVVLATVCTLPAAESRDRFGGWGGVRGKATAFFHTEQIDGVWWLITPEGNAFFSKAANHINYNGDAAPALGCAPQEAVEAMAEFIDVVSFNNYGFTPPAEQLRKLHAATGKPVMLTEFSFKAKDSGLPNTKGAGQPVATQQDRAEHFDRYVSGLANMPFLVGYHWFQYFDQPAEGRFDGEERAQP